jgi:hypothetical protein
MSCLSFSTVFVTVIVIVEITEQITERVKEFDLSMEFRKFKNFVSNQEGITQVINFSVLWFITRRKVVETDVSGLRMGHIFKVLGRLVP